MWKSRSLSGISLGTVVVYLVLLLGAMPALADELPIAELGDDWETLLLDQGLFIAPRVDVSLTSGVRFVLAYEVHAGGKTKLQFLAYTGGTNQVLGSK